ncbi:hypothetical protein [Massilia glaciei]|uniref:hypothetical protein n=1 Tax=Massilia glaciei TaxID=1524097 RepID=UPI0015E80160|nr:hypothetical protein [Massilia glaciei]
MISLAQGSGERLGPVLHAMQPNRKATVEGYRLRIAFDQRPAYCRVKFDKSNWSITSTMKRAR